MLERTAFHSTVRRVPFVDGLAGVTETIGPSSASLYPQAIFLPSVSCTEPPSIKNDGHLNIGMFHALIVGKVAESFFSNVYWHVPCTHYRYVIAEFFISNV